MGPLSPDEIAWMKRIGAAARDRSWIGNAGPETNR
jgi:hypothetical protein